MKAAILTAQGADLVIDDVELVAPLDFGQVLVRVAYTGICGSQIGEIDGAKGPDPYMPHLLGHEGSGWVEDVGPGVTTVAAGDRVVLHWRPGAGLQARPPAYRWRGEKLNAGWVTTFNEQAVVSENRVTKIPDDFPMELGPLLGCAVTTGLGVVTNDARLKIGESLVVFGAGGIGLSVVQGAALAGAHPIVAIDLHDHKLELAGRLGATHLLNSSTRDVADDVRQIVGDAGADVVVDNTGASSVIAAAYGLTAPAGRTILVGVPAMDDPATLHTLPLHFGKVLTGSHGGDAAPAVDIPRYVALAAAGKLDLAPLITDRFELDQINDAIRSLRAGEVAGRCLVAVAPEEPR